GRAVGDGRMRVAEVALVGGAGGFGEPGDFFEIEAQGVPVDEGDDAQGEQRVFDQKPRQRAVGQRARGAGERAGEGAVGTGVVVDADGEAFAGRGQFEVEGDID